MLVRFENRLELCVFGDRLLVDLFHNSDAASI